jgi:hypothetical protein
MAVGVGRKCVVGVATRYGLDSSGTESRWGREFPHSPDRHGAHPAYRSIPGVKRPGHDVHHPPPSSTDAKEYSYTSTPPLGLRGLF